ATSAVNTSSKAKKKKAEVAESSEEEQEETKSHKNACKKSCEAKKSKKSTNASTKPVHLTRAEQALVDQNISIVPPMCPRVAATVTSVTVASVPPVSTCQHRLEAHTECAAAVVEDMNSDSSSSDNDTQSACAHSHVLSDDSSVVSTKSGTLLATVAPGDSTPIDQRLESCGSSLTNKDMAKVNTALTISTSDHELGSTITPSATSAPVTPPAINSSVIVTKPASVINDVQMMSPPLSPSQNLQDVDDFIESDVIPTKGEVHLYTSHGDPQQTDPSKVKPAMFVKHEMSSLTLGPVLNKLGSRFSPIKKSNSHIFTWEEDMWNIKGRFEDAIQDDDDAPWVKENNKYII
ncbi:hypothetical protein H0H87_007863, partial [Tephrocybe sp. NHM501043]